MFLKAFFLPPLKNLSYSSNFANFLANSISILRNSERSWIWDKDNLGLCFSVASFISLKLGVLFIFESIKLLFSPFHILSFLFPFEKSIKNLSINQHIGNIVSIVKDWRIIIAIKLHNGCRTTC